MFARCRVLQALLENPHIFRGSAAPSGHFSVMSSYVKTRINFNKVYTVLFVSHRETRIISKGFSFGVKREEMSSVRY